jgi:hypothetical protein
MEGDRVVYINDVYVDGILIKCIKYHIYNIINKIKDNFKVSKCDKINYILGINIERKKQIILFIKHN